MAVLAVAVLFAAASPPAQAAASGASPDPSPQAASGGPAPDPAPQAAPVASGQSAPAAQSGAPVVPRPTASGIGVGSPGGSAVASGGGSSPITATPQIAPSPPLRRSIRHPVHRVQKPARWVSTVAGQVSAPWRANPLLTGAEAGSGSTGSTRDGLLLLLGSAALAVLALASASMVRLLRRMDEVVS